MKKSTTSLLLRLRHVMKATEYVTAPIDAYIVPSGDSHQSEYIATCDKRREFISGFSGSTGIAVITREKAALWTDGRYFIQAQEELDDNWSLMKTGMPSSVTIEHWLSKELDDGAKVGVDPSLLSLDEWQRISRHLTSTNRHLIRIDNNLIDVVWEEIGKPSRKLSSLMIYQQQFAGKAWHLKVIEVRKEMEKSQADALVITALDEIAWLLNLRGSDIEFNPVFFAYAIITMDAVLLFIDELRITEEIRAHLTSDKVKMHTFPYENINEQLRTIVSDKKKIQISSTSSAALASLVPEKQLFSSKSPVAAMKAVKNENEIQGMRQSHIWDAAALCQYFAWLEREVPKGGLTEFSASQELDRIRRAQDSFVGNSFETISASGTNGAIVHYRPRPKDSLLLSSQKPYLCDSGAHYLGGTTDVTRTMHFGTPSSHEKCCFTRVLQGHIQLAKSVFPRGTRGHVLDILARRPLWNCGLDYYHGTGHGVGAFLNVHEGPHGISPKVSNDHPLQEGMFVTNEPGYYEDGSFGIRIENVMLICSKQLEHNFKDVGFLGFEPITLVPIQLKMIMMDMLTEEEINWLNDYHDACRTNVAPLLRDTNQSNALEWLMRQTQTIG